MRGLEDGRAEVVGPVGRKGVDRGGGRAAVRPWREWEGGAGGGDAGRLPGAGPVRPAGPERVAGVAAPGDRPRQAVPAGRRRAAVLRRDGEVTDGRPGRYAQNEIHAGRA